MSFEGSRSAEQNDYLKVRVFLYKYTPPFTKLSGPSTGPITSPLSQNIATAGVPSTTSDTCSYETQGNIARFSCPFDPANFSRFEITSFLHNYSVTQSLKNMENSLNINFLNDVISMSDLECPVSISAPTQSSLNDAASAFKTAFAGNSSPRGIRRPVFFPIANPTNPDEYANYKQASTSSLSANDLVTNIAQYYTETATEFSLDSIRTEVAMRLRGVKDPTRLASLQQDFASFAPLGLDLQDIRQAFQRANAPGTGVGNNLGADGILLSDLIQKFDMVSVIVYRWPFPSNLVEQHLRSSQPNLFDTEPMMFACPASLLPTSQLTTAATATAVVPLYESEFLGFVSDIGFSNNPGSSAPTVSISASGVASLLDVSRRIYAATIFQTGIFEAGEMPNVMGDKTQSMLFANTLQSFKKGTSGDNRTTSPIDILKVLLGEFYHIKFYTPQSSQGPQLLPIVSSTAAPTTCYIDIQEMEYNNNVLGATAKGSIIPISAADIGTPIGPSILSPDGNTNIGLVVPSPVPAGPNELSRGSTSFLSIPSYLYALVMRMRKFNVLVANSSYTEVNPRFYGLQADAVGDSPLVINANFFAADAFTPYFVRLNGALGQYNPSTKTAKEIIQEVNAMAYTEFFETPGGRLVFRTPQFNNITSVSTGTTTDPNSTALMCDSSQIDPISSEYTDTREHLISGYQMSVSLQMMDGIIPNLYPRYSNGKVLSQYGFFQNAPLSNPNVQPTNQAQPSPQELTGMQQFCRFFYEFNNSILKNGTITYVGNSLVAVGQTFYDITNQKFGYVTAVSKQAEVGGTYTATASLSMIRNTMPTFSFIPGSPKSITPSVYALPTLESVVSAFSGKSVDTDPTPLVSTKKAPKVNRQLAISKMATISNALVSNVPVTGNPHPPADIFLAPNNGPSMRSN